MSEAVNKKTREGVVVSDKMQKSVVVSVERRYRHPFYGKVVSSAKRFMAHDEKGIAKLGDRVVIIETRPISKNKCWAVLKVLGKEKQ